MKTKLLLFTGAAILALVLGSVGIAAAQADGSHEPGTPAQRGGRVYGVIEDIKDGTLTLATPVGLVTLITDTNTRFRVPDVEEPSLDDLATGDYLAAAGWWEREGSTFHAFGVARLETGRVFPLAGKLADIGDDTLTVETGHGLATVRVDGETVYRTRDVEEPGLDDLEAGMRVVARGTLGLDGSLLAQVVAVPWVGPRQARLTGKVSAIKGTTLALDTPGGQVNVLTDAETVFRVPGVEEPTLADVDTGDQVIATGIWEDETTFRAIGVGVRGGRRAGQRGVVRGRAIGVGTDRLVLGTLRGPVTVLLDDETRYRVPGVDDPGSDDIEVGASVGVRGVWNENGTLQAVGVAVLDGR